MKYFTGTLVFDDHESRREQSRQYAIAAADRPQALSLLSDEARYWGGEEGRKVSNGQWVHDEAEGRGLTISVYDVTEISFADFEVLRRYVHVLRARVAVASQEFEDAAREAPDEALKTLARSIHAALKSPKEPLSLQLVLETLSTTIGAKNWAHLRSQFDDNGKRIPKTTLPEGAHLQVDSVGPDYAQITAFVDGKDVLSVNNHIGKKWHVGGVTAYAGRTLEEGIRIAKAQLAALERAQELQNKT